MGSWGPKGPIPICQVVISHPPKKPISIGDGIGNSFHIWLGELPAGVWYPFPCVDNCKRTIFWMTCPSKHFTVLHKQFKEQVSLQQTLNFEILWECQQKIRLHSPLSVLEGSPLFKAYIPFKAELVFIKIDFVPQLRTLQGGKFVLCNSISVSRLGVDKGSKCTIECGQTSITHRIHVGYIYLHLVHVYGNIYINIPYMDPLGYGSGK